MINIKQKISTFISSHEMKVQNDINIKNNETRVRFTKFGNRAGCNALYDIFCILDTENQEKVIELMKNPLI